MHDGLRAALFLVASVGLGHGFGCGGGGGCVWSSLEGMLAEIRAGAKGAHSLPGLLDTCCSLQTPK
eukprot:21972-Chlamydomonas_euryale.AAC.2